MEFNYNLFPGRKEHIRRTKTETVISIVTPFFNSGNYIEQTAKSVIGQTFPNFEWIIVDDGSTDSNSIKKLDEIKKMDDRISIYHKKNGGLAETRDFGAERSCKESKYLVFLDDDDLINETFLECCFWTLETNNEASWAYVDTVNFGEETYLWKKWFDCEKEKKENLLVAMAMIRKKDFIKVNGYQLREKAIFEDWNLWLKMIANNMYPVRISFPGFWYRRKEKYLSELNRSNGNRERAMKYINEQASNIKKNITAIQYPKFDYNLENLEDDISIMKLDCKTNDDSSKNILMFFPWIVLGGADKFNVELAKGLKERGYSITVITTEPKVNELRQEMEEYATVFDLTTFLDQRYWINFINYIVEKNNIRYIFISNCKFAYSAIPYIKKRYPYLKIYDYIHMKENHGGFFELSNCNKEYIDKTFFCNKYTESVFKSDYAIQDKENKRYETTYIGVDTKEYDPKKYNKEDILKKYKELQGKFIIIFICRLEKQKNPLLMLKIIRELKKEIKDIHLLIVGNGSEKNSMLEYVKKKHLNKFVSFIPGTKDVRELYAISDVMVNCSENEGIPLTTYEAISMNIPVVASNVGGEREVINSNNGILINDICNLQEYASAIKKIYNKEVKFYRNDRLEFVEKYDIKNMVNKFDEELSKKNMIIKSNRDYDMEFAKQNIMNNLINNKEEYVWQVKEFNNEYLNHDNSSGRRSIKEILLRILKKMHIYNMLVKIIKGAKNNE